MLVDASFQNCFLFLSVMSEIEKSSHSTPVKKIIKISPEDVCIICNVQNYDLRPFQENHSKTDTQKCYIDALFKCFNIHILNPEYDISNTKVCQTCVHRMRRALSFRKVVREAQQRIQNKIDLLLNDSHSIECKTSQNIKHKTKVKYSKPNPNFPDELLDNGDTKDISVFNGNVSQSKYLKLFKSESNLLIPKDEPSDNDDNTENIFNGSSDGQSSTTSEQMRIATGGVKINYNFRPRVSKYKHIIDKSCKTCSICNETFETFRLLEFHQKGHSMNYVCHVCGMSFKTEGSFKFHTDRHEGVFYPCSLCKKKLNSKNQVAVHIRTFHNKEKLYACAVCDERFSSLSTKNKHISVHHPHIPVQTHECDVCGKVFMKRYCMVLHKNAAHDKIHKFSCTECDFTSPIKRTIVLHMIVHNGARTHMCSFCGKAYARRGTLREHLKIHKNIRNFKCDICEKTFVQKCSLKGHMNTHYKN